MKKYTLKIDGMMCGMCEAHVNDVVRKNCNVNKVKSSHTKGECIIIANSIDEDTLRKSIADIGYTLISITSEPYEKKGFLSKFFK